MKTSPILIFLMIFGLASLGHSREECTLPRLSFYDAVPLNSKLDMPVIAVTCDGNDCNSADSQTEKIDNSGLWMLTAIVTESYTMHKDTLISFDAGNHKWDKEKHVSVKNLSRGGITAVIENQAENQTKDFSFNTDAGEPISITVSGGGSHTESSDYIESIDGKMINADNRKINVSGSALPKASVQFDYSDEYKYAGIVINIKAKGSDNGRIYDGEWKDYGDKIDDYSISCSGGCDISSDKTCHITKTASGYHASWKSNENKQRHTVDGTEFITSESTLEVTISPYKEPDKPKVTLNGCSELGKEEQSEVMATGSPEGGKFRFWVEPDNLLNVQANGESSATLTGASPGKGTLYVEYTSPEGKINQTSQPASCVKIDSYNGGEAIPQIAFYDADGKRLEGIKRIPVSVSPSEGTDLLKFVPADLGVLSVQGLGDQIDLQGVHEGKTTLHATTDCGTTTGPTVDVEVVNCDDETIATLERMMEAAKEGQKEAYKRIEEITGSEEYEKAGKEITESTIELAAKTALTIIGSGKTEGAVETAVEIAEAGESVSEMVASATAQKFNDQTIIATLKAVGSHAVKALAGAMGVHEAAKKFGENLGTLMGTEDELKSAMEEAENWNKQVQEIVRRQRLCRRSSEQPSGTDQPKTDPTPPPTKPTTKNETPPVQQPTTTPESPPSQEPAAGDTPAEEPPISPPPPTSEPRQVGLPYSPASECGCNSSQGIGVSGAGFSAMQTGMKNLGKCVDSFSKGPLTDYILTLKAWTTVTDSLAEAVKTGPDGFQLTAKKAVTRIDELIGRTKSYDEAGKSFTKEFQACSGSMKAGVEIIGSAKNLLEISASGK